MTISDVTLKNITVHGNWMSLFSKWHVGIIRCNEKNPCKGLKFINVNF